ncbi:hypothetical protein HK102_007126, partial [Quaeritorhiza haematococci]
MDDINITAAGAPSAAPVPGSTTTAAAQSQNTASAPATLPSSTFLNGEHNSTAALSINKDLRPALENNKTASGTSLAKITVRCPSYPVETFAVQTSLDSSVLDLKLQLLREFPARPKVEDQRLIHGGKLLENTLSLRDVFKK